jgi:hypothetical protein
MYKNMRYHKKLKKNTLLSHCRVHPSLKIAGHGPRLAIAHHGKCRNINFFIFSSPRTPLSSGAYQQRLPLVSLYSRQAALLLARSGG